MKYLEAERLILLGGARAIHKSWPQRGWSCFIFRRNGVLWFKHTDGKEHPVQEEMRTIWTEHGSTDWVTLHA